RCRIPRPHVSAKPGTPNACNDCHADKSAQWAASAIEGWHGPNRKGFQAYAEAFDRAWTDRADAAALLGAVASGPNVPGFVRASALAGRAPHVSAGNTERARAGRADPHPVVRGRALDLLSDQ